MTLGEFKAWFEGFTENVEKSPTQKQWARIKERVGEIDDKPVTWPVYVDRWVYPYRYTPYWNSPTFYSNGSAEVTSSYASLTLANSAQAMHVAGQAEAAAMN